MRHLATLAVLCLLGLFGAPAAAQPAGSAAAPTAALTPADAEKRKICAEAMNADPTFAAKIVEVVNENTAKEHRRAAQAIAKNEKHVILAYAAMWIIAALFVLFLWRRQQALKSEIAHLRRDLDAATKDGK